MSFSDTIFLFFLALVLFGPKKLPEIARQAGKLLAELRRASNEFRSQIESEIANLEVEKSRNATLAATPESLPASPQHSVARQKEPASLAEPSIHPGASAADSAPAESSSGNASLDSSSKAVSSSIPETTAARQESHV